MDISTLENSFILMGMTILCMKVDIPVFVDSQSFTIINLCQLQFSR